MAELQPATWEQSVCSPAQALRLAQSGTVCQQGVAFNVLMGGSSSLEVTAGGGLSVDVAPGVGFVDGGSTNFGRGMYAVAADTATNLPLAAADPSLDRIDLVYAQIRDSEYGEAAPGSSDWILAVETGTPGSGSPPSPTPPALPLAEVTVQAGAGSVSPGDVGDVRQPYVACGQLSDDNIDQVRASLAPVVLFRGGSTSATIPSTNGSATETVFLPPINLISEDTSKLAYNPGNAIRMQVDGLIQVEGSVRWDTLPDSAPRRIGILAVDAGDNVIEQTFRKSSSNTEGQLDAISGTFLLSAGDGVTLRVGQSSGSPADLQFARMHVTLLRDDS